MTGNPYTVPAYIFLAAVLSGVGAWAFLAITGLLASGGRHAKGAAASAAGDRFVAELRGEDAPPDEHPAPRGPDEVSDPDETAWWDERPPQPPAAEVLTGPGAPSPQTSDTVIGVLAQARDAMPPPAPPAEPPLDVRQPRTVPDAPAWRAPVGPAALARVADKLLPDAWKPGPGEATFTPADPDATMTDLPAVPGAPQYLAAPQ